MTRIALLGHIRHPIAPPFAGGMEAHSWHLARELAARGHDVTLFASGDSEESLPPGVRLHPVVSTHYDAVYPWHRFHGTAALNTYLDQAHADAARALVDGRFDVVHNNGLHRFIPRAGVAHGLPMVTSLHVPPFDALRRAVLDSVAPWTRFTVTSERQKEKWWTGDAPAQAVVLSNGIDPADWPFVAQGDGTAVWSGRITPNKGTHLAVRAARRAGMPLRIFGAIEHRDYFEGAVRPHLGDDIVYEGHLTGADLADRVGRASVLLFTPLWDEPFGLAAIEAMACGVPVACTDMGAVREVVADCGAYARPDDVRDLARAIRRAVAVPRAHCRARVESLFTIGRMVDRTEALYAEAIAARPRSVPPHRYPPWELSVAASAPTAITA